MKPERESRGEKQRGILLSIEEGEKRDNIKWENRNGEGNVWKREVSTKAHHFQIIIF
jgi:hypothetical protein